MKRIFLMLAAVAVAGAAWAKPNIVLIVADDMGYGDLGCYDGVQQTPHLDQLAKEGLRFTDFHSSGSVCSPSRAGMITGQYQQRVGVDGVINADSGHMAHSWGVDPKKVMNYPRELKKQGYATALFGKWHLGYLPQYHPMNLGFDRFVGYLSGNIDYHSHYDRMQVYDWWHDREQVKEEGYSTHLITKHTLDYIKSHQGQPFCILVAHEAVHSPMQGPEEPILRGPERGKSNVPKRTDEEIFRSMIGELDRSVGEIIAALKETGLDQNTLVLFTSDNGPMKFSSPGNLRGKKGTIFEGGHRVPTIAWWPGRVAPGVTDATACGIDLMPTVFELAGVNASKDWKFDGVSLLPVLEGGKLKERSLFWMSSAVNLKFKPGDTPKSRARAIRKGPWKLLLFGVEGIHLYNLDEDISEAKNLARAHPERAAEMKAELLKWEADVSKGLPYQIGEPLLP